jgi:ribulose 1,5-bisphosphate synthetase/thiazole synthase
MGNPKTHSSLTYDVVIVGVGSAGLTAAKLAGKKLKNSRLLVEVERLGGGGATCWRLHLDTVVKRMSLLTFKIFVVSCFPISLDISQ